MYAKYGDNANNEYLENMAYIRCQNYILLLIILLCDIDIAFCYMHGIFCYLISPYANSYCILLHECHIRLHAIRKLDILLRYIDVIFCEMNCGSWLYYATLHYAI